MIRLSLSQKLTSWYVLLSLIMVFVIAFIFYEAFEAALLKRTSAQLSSINILKKDRIENYFVRMQQDLEKFLDTPDLRTSMDDFSKVHQVEGVVVVTYTGDSKLLTSYPSSFLSQNDLQLAGSEHDSPGQVHEIEHLDNMLRVKAEHDSVIAFAYFDVDEVDDILYERTGLGTTGESYIVGDDLYMRSHSRFFPERDPSAIKVETPAARAALSGESGFKIVDDYRGIPVLSYFRPLEIHGVNWSVLTEIDRQEALQPVRELGVKIFAIAFVVAFIFAGVTAFLVSRITRPLKGLQEILLKLSRGVLAKKAVRSRSDEIGEMTDATNSLIESLRSTADFATEIGKGNFDREHKPLSKDDVLGLALIQMRDRLKKLTALQVKLVRDNTKKLIEGQEEERKRIARELHDSIGQMVTTVRLLVGGTKMDLERKDHLKQLLDETIDELRRVSNNLMPSVLVDFGLEAGLKKLVREVSESTGINVVYDYEMIPEADPLDFEISMQLYRVIQESLNNAVRHGKPDNITVLVKHSDSVEIQISDDGKGFDLEEIKKSGGIKHIKERISMLSGDVDIKSKKGEGTQLKVFIPLYNN